MNKAGMVLCALLFATTLTAQETLYEIDVQLRGCNAREVALIRGNDRSPIPLSSQGTSWTNKGTSIPGNAKVSLRLNPGGRTPCRRTVPGEEDDRGRPKAVFIFRCSARDDHAIQLDAGHRIPIGYRRHVGKVKTESWTHECDETGALGRGEEIRNVDTELEDIYIYPGFSDQRSARSGRLYGILLDELAASSQSTFSATELSQTTLEKVATSTPHLAPSVHDVTKKALQKAGVKSVAVAVQR